MSKLITEKIAGHKFLMCCLLTYLVHMGTTINLEAHCLTSWAGRRGRQSSDQASDACDISGVQQNAGVQKSKLMSK